MKRIFSIWLPVALLAVTVMAASAQDQKRHTFVDPLFEVQSEYVTERGANSEKLQEAKEESVASRLDLAIECFDVVGEEPEGKVSTLPEPLPLPDPEDKVATLPEPLPLPDPEDKVATLPEPLPLPDPEDKAATVNSKAVIPIPIPDPGSKAGPPALPDKKPASQYAYTGKGRGETDEEYNLRMVKEHAKYIRANPEEASPHYVMGTDVLAWNKMVDRWERAGVFDELPPAIKLLVEEPKKVAVPKIPKTSYDPEPAPVPSAAYAPSASGQEEDVPQVLHLMFNYVQCTDARWVEELESGNSGLSESETQALLDHCDQEMQAYQQHMAQRMNKRFAEEQSRRLKAAAGRRVRSGVN